MKTYGNFESLYLNWSRYRDESKSQFQCHGFLYLLMTKILNDVILDFQYKIFKLSLNYIIFIIVIVPSAKSKTFWFYETKFLELI